MAKPTVEELGVDPAALRWHRSGAGPDALEVAFVGDPGQPDGTWVLLRTTAEPAGRILVYDRNEWECFLDGVRGGEFDDALG
jgi:Domain of unknown function (DUF397)